MPRSSTAHRRVASTERLLEAASQELLAHGGDLEMQGVAGRADVSVGLAYHHFGSKGGLIAAVLSDFYDRLDEVAMARRIEGPWAERERERIRLCVDFYLKEPLSTILLGRVHRAPEVVAVEADRFHRQVEMGARNMADGQAQAAIPADLDPALLAAMVLGGVRHGITQALGQAQPPDPEALTDQVWRFVAGAVGLAAGRAPAG